MKSIALLFLPMRGKPAVCQIGMRCTVPCRPYRRVVGPLDALAARCGWAPGLLARSHRCAVHDAVARHAVAAPATAQVRDFPQLPFAGAVRSSIL
jgi:hypothetical protein